MNNKNSLEHLIKNNALVTGGAGFIGSHVVDALVERKFQVKVFDNLSNGNTNNLQHAQETGIDFVKADLRNPDAIGKVLQQVDIVFHLAAYPEVRTGFNNPEIFFKENVLSTFNLLESIRRSNVETIVFTSSSTVYGEPNKIPTPEEYGPMLPISTYGASKLASEAMISSYCKTYGIRGVIFRLANIIGSRSNHGIIIDFIKKLKQDSTVLNIFGDGNQSKSYLHVSDCINAILHGITKSQKNFDIFNIGNDDKTDVMTIAKTVCDEMNLKNVKLRPDGGVDGGRGWSGDVKDMQLDITKLKKLDWHPTLSSLQAVQKSCGEIQNEIMVENIAT